MKTILLIIMMKMCLASASASQEHSEGSLGIEAFDGLLLFPANLYIEKSSWEKVHVRLSNAKIYSELTDGGSSFLSVRIGPAGDEINQFSQVADVNLNCFGFKQSVIVEDDGKAFAYFYDDSEYVSITTNETSLIFRALTHFIQRAEDTKSLSCLQPLILLIQEQK
ncbi:hypothetical protein [Aliidiomarina indica]|uniref:hypothetical protein n=1 Tax=Aliidiomarina indica TaxID=2749147 RepID=UPI00188F7C81|nr:hypothetical protein [Aliidiomarina indica]